MFSGLFVVWLVFFKDRISLCFPNCPQTVGLKPSSCCGLLSTWAHRCVPLSLALTGCSQDLFPSYSWSVSPMHLQASNCLLNVPDLLISVFFSLFCSEGLMISLSFTKIIQNDSSLKAHWLVTLVHLKFSYPEYYRSHTRRQRSGLKKLLGSTMLS